MSSQPEQGAPATPPAPPAAAVGPSFTVCPFCGRSLPAGSRFCAYCGMPLYTTTHPEKQGNRVYEWLSKHRAAFTALVFLFSMIVLFWGAASPVSPAQVQQYNSTLNNLGHVRAEAYLPRAVSIMSNNLEIATIEIIPVLGVFFFLLSMYQTGFVVSILGATGSTHVPGVLVAFSLMLLPHFWLETPAYSIAVSQGTILLVSFFAGWRYAKKELLNSVFIWIFVALELFVAAMFESGIISLESTGALQPFLFWIPFFIVIIAAYGIIKKMGLYRRLTSD
jgi:hypothetical protein